MSGRDIYTDNWSEFLFYYITGFLFYPKGYTHIYFHHKDWYV